jgi:hypothetical protein
VAAATIAQEAQGLLSAGTVADVYISGTLEAQQAGNTAASAGTVAIAGAAAIAQAAQTVLGQAEVLVVGAAAPTQAGNTLVADGWSRDTVAGTAALTQADNTVVSVGRISTPSGVQLLCFRVLDVSTSHALYDASPLYNTLDVHAEYASQGVCQEA